jgi:hypothetical protein
MYTHTTGISNVIYVNHISYSTCGSIAATSSWPVIGALGAACSGTGLSDGLREAPKAVVRVLNGASLGDSHEIHCTTEQKQQYEHKTVFKTVSSD